MFGLGVGGFVAEVVVPKNKRAGVSGFRAHTSHL